MNIKYILFFGSIERAFTTDEELFAFIKTLLHNAEIQITVIGK